MEKRKKRKKWPYVLAIIAVVLVAVVVLARQVKKASDELFQYSTYKVSRGSVVSSVTGTGVLAFAQTKSVALPAGIKLSDVLVQAGDSMLTGEVMAALDTASLETRQKELLNEIASLDMQLGSMQKSNTQSRVTSLVEGRVVKIYAEQGGDVYQTLLENGALMLLSTDGKLMAEFTAADVLEKGAEVEVTLSSGETVDGKVEAVTGGKAVVTVDDADASYGDAVKIYRDSTLVGEAELVANAPLTVVAQSGTVDEIKVDEGDRVRMGTVLITLTDAPYTKEYSDAYEARKTAANTLATVRAYLGDPYVRATENCVVRMVYFKDGDTLGGASSAASASMTASASASGTSSLGDVTLFDVGLSSELEVLFDADELDVPLLKIGQQATVTVNALSDETFAATVTSIAGSGDAYNGVTSYRVRLSLEPDARLNAGMNCSAVIAIDRRDNVLVVPLITIDEDAEGMFTYVSPSGGKTGGDRVRKTVTTGLSDGISVEILSGLQEGDTISYEDGNAMMENMMKMFGERLG